MLGAECMLRSLLAQGVDTFFVNPGTSEMQFVIALDRVPEMRGVLCLQEVVCSGAADGYARMLRRPAATLLHLGPGMANALSNFHNARKAKSPIVNIIGEHATFHMMHDAPLSADVPAFARPVSKWVETAPNLESIGPLTAEAFRVSMERPCGVASLITPADFTWSVAGAVGETVALPQPAVPSDEWVAEAARFLSSGSSAALVVSGDALLDPCRELLGRISQATGARVFANRFSARFTRGRGLWEPARIPYFPEPAQAALAGFTHIVLLETGRPVSFFGYPNVRSEMAPPDCEFLTLSAETLPALQALAERLGAVDQPFVEPAAAPALPSDDALTLDTLGQALAALLPEGAIVADEMVSSADPVVRALRNAARHDFLPVTGGSIGQGLPVAVGAAVACPDRQVFALVGDGSAMYCLPSLWTMAREKLNVIVVIFANRRYQILDFEVRRTGSTQAGEKAEAMLALTNPGLDWMALAKGNGVESGRAETLPAFVDLLRSALEGKGPFLIEAVL